MKQKNITKLIINSSIALFFILCVIAPIISMLCRITPTGFREVIESPQFGVAVVNSVSTAFVATIISLLLAMTAAWCTYRTDIKQKAFFGMIFILPMLIPSISHAFGLVALFGANGLLTNLFNLKGSIYGFWGIVIGAVLYSFPVAFLMFSSILKYEDGMIYKAATVMGIPMRYQFLNITLPYLKKTIISAFFAVFTMIVTDYGIPLMVGGKTITLSVLMYNKAVGLIDYDGGSVIGAFLLIPAIIAFLVDIFNPERSQSGYISEQVVPQQSILRDVAAYLFCGCISVCIFAPIVSFCVMLFEAKYPVDSTFTMYHIHKTISRGADTYLLNSLLYSFATAVVGTALAFICAYMTSRLNGRFIKGLHLISITSMAIPGIVLGLSYVIFFHNSPRIISFRYSKCTLITE